jgi:hypothetical protein
MADVYGDIYSDIYGVYVTPPVFPQAALAIMVELDVGGTWTDISDWVYQRDVIKITSGQPDETTAPQPAQATLTLNNRDGRFTLRNPLSPFYGLISRNSQLRISVQSDTGTTSDLVLRFWGEVSEWPPAWDPTGTDVYCQIIASGVLRRLGQSGVLGSVVRRYYGSLRGTAAAPVAYWTCEDADGSASLASATGGSPMAMNGFPTMASNTDFFGSDALPLLSLSSWTGVVSSAKIGSAAARTGSVTFNSGSGTFMPPTPSGTCTPQLWAPSGGGGGSTTDTFGGGGGGGYVTKKAYAFSGGTGIAYSIGTPGVAGTTGNGGDAGNVTFGTLAAYGGKGGTNTDGGLGGSGLAPGGTVYPGGKGGAPGSSAGGGGSSGGISAKGNPGQAGGATGGLGGTVKGGGSGGRGGTGTGTKKTWTRYYNAVHTYAFQGSDGTSPNARINIDGAVYQGGSHAQPPGFGHTKTFMMLNYAQIAADLAGATITAVKVRLANLTSWSPDGTIVSLGWDVSTHSGSSNTDPASNNSIYEARIARGATAVLDVTGLGFGVAFQSGGATCLKLYKLSNVLNYQGTFAGFTSPQLQITYTK